mmetsp:Transcript_125782/g.367609  ORF Transcript_125782/g.367609 Transcript_125782/m.367609 type:complete len:237 (-) Transcript_125782:268-978(-)
MLQCMLASISIKHGQSEAVSITLEFEAPLLTPSAVKQSETYAWITRCLLPASPYANVVVLRCTKPLAQCFCSCFHIPVTRCLPSTLTQSTTYSVPSRNSCTKTSWFLRPRASFELRMTWTAVTTAEWQLHLYTLSVPVDAHGFTTTGQVQLSCKNATASCTELHRRCAQERRPHCRSCSCIACLSQRQRESGAPFPRSPRTSASASASSTPEALPATTARTRPAASSASAVAATSP